MNNFSAPIVTVLMGIIGVAILATLVSRNSNTTQIIKTSSDGFSNALGTALSPVTGGYQLNRYGGGF